MPRFFWYLVAGFTLVVWVNACGGDDKCRMDSDCSPGRYCVYDTGDCIFDCAVDAQCMLGFVCDSRGRCVVGCTTDDACQSGQWCQDGQCTACADDFHCGADCWNCTRLDTNKVCLADTCGCRMQTDCAPGEDCFDSRCQLGCEPACAGRVCGPDGCGSVCGQCDPSATCGADGGCHCEFTACGQACCEAGQVCEAGACCTPDCSGVSCGPDPVCGTDCGGGCDPWGCNLETGGCMANQVTAMTGPDQPAGIASGSEPALLETAAWKAFDHTDSPWVTGGMSMPPYFLTYEFTDAPMPRPIAAYAIQFNAAHGALNMAPRNWTFKGHDGQAWATLDTQIDQVGWSEGEVRTYGLAPTACYSRYQLSVSVTNGNVDTAIGELILLY